MAVSLTACSCSSSFDLMICAKCGGTLSTNTMLSRLDDGTLQWFSELDSDGRLSFALANYASIDRQIRRGIPATTMLQTLKDTISGPGGLTEEIENKITKRFEELRCENENSTKLLREIVVEQVGAIVGEIKGLVEQGKSITDIESRVREATGALQTYLTAIRIPALKGEEGEVNAIRDLQEAFIGQTCFKVEPIGGADATDAIIHFHQAGIEIGSCLVEVKSRNSWSNDFVEQVRADMKRYDVALAILATNKLPKSAKGRGFRVDGDFGLVVIASSEMIVPTVSMYYEISLSTHNIHKHNLDLKSIAANRDLSFYLNDNMKILAICKQISDATDDSARIIKGHLVDISSRLRENNGKIACILSASTRESH
ncbi:MAG: DUF2130 domain-containing protein [Candidatus Bathyarchaeia archaeon]